MPSLGFCSAALLPCCHRLVIALPLCRTGLILAPHAGRLVAQAQSCRAGSLCRAGALLPPGWARSAAQAQYCRRFGLPLPIGMVLMALGLRSFAQPQSPPRLEVALSRRKTLAAARARSVAQAIAAAWGSFWYASTVLPPLGARYVAQSLYRCRLGISLLHRRSVVGVGGSICAKG